MNEFTILLVDDHPENLFALEVLLEKKGRRILKANSGNEALSILLNDNDIGLIITDVQMPEIDGFEFVKLIKSNSRTKDIYVIFVTAISRDNQNVVKGLSEGGVDYLFKPLEAEITRAKVNIFEQLYLNRKELEEKNRILNEINEQKNRLLGIAAHDLRNPLAVIYTYCDFLLENPDSLNFGQLEIISDMFESSKFMSSLINNLLDISKIEAGKLELDLDLLDIVSVIKHNISMNRVLAEKKNIMIKFSCFITSKEVLIDRIKIEQVLNNLISNAIKFSYPDSVIEIGIKPQDTWILLSVKDNGQGIPNHEIEKMFKPFETTSVKSTAGEKSTGLGLAIAKKIVEGHQGKIWVESEVNKGTAFYVKLPQNIEKPALRVSV
jgi:signal transduction histidine kinase